MIGPQFIACVVDLARELRGGGVVGTSWSGTPAFKFERNRVRLWEQDRFAWCGWFNFEGTNTTVATISTVAANATYTGYASCTGYASATSTAVATEGGGSKAGRAGWAYWSGVASITDRAEHAGVAHWALRSCGTIEAGFTNWAGRAGRASWAPWSSHAGVADWALRSGGAIEAGRSNDAGST